MTINRNYLRRTVRDKKEYRELYEKVGFELMRTVPTSTEVSVIEGAYRQAGIANGQYRFLLNGVAMKFAVDVISDVICPWCYIGKRRLEKAIAVVDLEIGVRWHPFQLNPTMPPEGISRKEYRARKFGSWERSLDLDAKVIAVGESDGIHFAFDKSDRTPNTVDAHRLIWLADQHGCQNAVVEALFRAYFTEGKDIGDRVTLIDVALESGLDRQSAETLLNSEAGLEVIAQAGELHRQHHVESVPFFVINNATTLSGAHSPETFVEAFKQAET